jgi:hypothetical protein
MHKPVWPYHGTLQGSLTPAALVGSGVPFAVSPVPARRVAVRAASDDVNKKLQDSLQNTTEYLSKTWEKVRPD